jgi:EAL domain-containing protein (putative c-di-GMP-specific phosphodiesterase class I)
MAFDTSVLQGVYQLWYGPDLVHIHGRRERRALMLGSLGMVVMGVFWGIYFSAVGNWPLVAMDLVLMLGGLIAGVLIWRKQVHRAAVVTFSILLTVVCVIAWVFDAPTPQSPRTTHLYLLPLSVAALMVFRDSGVWLRHGVSAACLVAVGILSVRYGSPLPQYALPESVRAVGVWVQTVAALCMLYGMLHVMQNDAAVRSVLEDELQQALEQHQFELHYQPQLDVQGQVIAAEALIRWQHPQRGLVFPGKFIEVAEQTGQILPIGQWVLQQACEQLCAWSQQPACSRLRLAVNISQLQFRQKDFVAQVLSLIDRYGIDASLLELEITESMLVQDLPDIIQKMGAIRARGVTFSLDDFGTGYSSLNHLKTLPLNQLKIDQSFVRDVLTDANDASIARTIVALGHNLGLTVIAEGVESEAQHAFLTACGCEFFQGYLFSHALPEAAFLAYVQACVGAPHMPIAA